MKRLALTISALLVLVLAPPSQAAVKESSLRKLWAKFTVDQVPQFQKPKLACICKDGGSNSDRLGAMLAYNSAETKAACAVPNFGDGVVQNWSICTEYLLLSK